MNPLKPLLILSSAATIVLPSCVAPYPAAPPPHHPAPTVYRSGYEVRTLPSGYRTEVIGGTSYYVHRGTYYRSRGGRYVIVDAPHPHHYDGRRDVVITRLPPGYRVIERGGVRYYRAGNVYYQRRGAGYVVVRRPY